MLYTGKPFEDYRRILHHINVFCEGLGVSGVQIETKSVLETVLCYSKNFPHTGGVSKASSFKKAANFLVNFLCKSPIKTQINDIHTIEGLTKYDLNAVIGFDIALIILEGSQLTQSTGAVKTISKPLYLSNHSYADIIDALSQEIHPALHWQLISVLLEQITYKSNPHCEYRNETDKPAYYPTPCNPADGDDMAGV